MVDRNLKVLKVSPKCSDSTILNTVYLKKYDLFGYSAHCNATFKLMKETETSFEMIAAFSTLITSNFLYRVVEENVFNEEQPLYLIGLGTSEKESKLTLIKIDPMIDFLKTKGILN